MTTRRIGNALLLPRPDGTHDVTLLGAPTGPIVPTARAPFPCPQMGDPAPGPAWDVRSIRPHPGRWAEAEATR